MFNVKTIHNPADYHYFTPSSSGVPTAENAKTIFTGKGLLVSLYAFNNSASQVYLAVCDTATTQAASLNVTIYPVPATSFINVSTVEGDRIEAGLFLKAFTDAGVTTPAGNVMVYKVDWDAYVSFIS